MEWRVSMAGRPRTLPPTFIPITASGRAGGGFGPPAAAYKPPACSSMLTLFAVTFGRAAPATSSIGCC